jgi:ankyrin repeat protein
MESQTISKKRPPNEDQSTPPPKRIQLTSCGEISSEKIFNLILNKYQFVYPSTDPIQTLINIKKAYHFAIEMGDLDLIGQLFELGVDLNQDDKQNPTPLFIVACKIQNIDAIKKFINTCQKNNESIVIAIRNDIAVDKDCIFINLNTELTDKLYKLENKCYDDFSTNETTEAEDSPLIYAIKADKFPVVSAILKLGTDTSRDLPYHTLIDSVIYELKQHVGVILSPMLNKYISLLKEYHYDIHKLDKKGNNPLMSYCEQYLLLPKNTLIKKNNFEKVFNILVGHGCDPTQKNGTSSTPIELIIKNQLLTDEKIFQIFENLAPEKIILLQDLIYDIQDKKLIEFLLNRGITFSFSSKDHEGKTALLKALDKTNIYLATVILNKRSLNFKDLPFHFLIKKYLKGDFSKQNLLNHNPEETLIQLMTLLIRHGGNINQPNITGNNPLMSFCEGCILADNQAMVDHIIIKFWEFDADMTQKNRFGETPIEKIAEYQLLNNSEILSYLVEFTSEQIQSSSALLSHTTNIDIIKHFVKNGVSVDTYSRKGTTLLYRAVEAFNLDLVRELIALGANPTLPRLHEKSLSEYEALAQAKAKAEGIAEIDLPERFIKITPLEFINQKIETLGIEETTNGLLLIGLSNLILRLEVEMLTINLVEAADQQETMIPIDNTKEKQKLDEAKSKLTEKKSALATKLETCKKILYIFEGKENGDMVSTQPMELQGTQERESQ